MVSLNNEAQALQADGDFSMAASLHATSSALKALCTTIGCDGAWSGTPIRDTSCCFQLLTGVPYLRPGPRRHRGVSPSLRWPRLLNVFRPPTNL